MKTRNQLKKSRNKHPHPHFNSLNQKVAPGLRRLLDDPGAERLREKQFDRLVGLLDTRLPNGAKKFTPLPKNGSHDTTCLFVLEHAEVPEPMLFRVESNRGIAARSVKKVRGKPNDRTWILVVNPGADDDVVRARLDAVIKKAKHLESRRTADFARLKRRKQLVEE